MELSEKSNFHKGDENVSMAVTAHHNMSHSSVMRAGRVDNSSQSGGRPIVCPEDISVQGGGQTVRSATAWPQSIHYLEPPAHHFCASLYGYHMISYLTSKPKQMFARPTFTHKYMHVYSKTRLLLCCCSKWICFNKAIV